MTSPPWKASLMVVSRQAHMTLANPLYPPTRELKQLTATGRAPPRSGFCWWLARRCRNLEWDGTLFNVPAHP